MPLGLRPNIRPVLVSDKGVSCTTWLKNLNKNNFFHPQEERTELFKHFLNEKIRDEFSIEDDDVIKLAMDTAGSSVRDITDYLNKKIFKAVKKKSECFRFSYIIFVYHIVFS